MSTGATLTLGVVEAIVGSAVLWLIVFLARSVRRGANADISEVVGKQVQLYTAPIMEQFRNNGGSSLRDRVDSIDKKLESHIAYHKGQESVH